MASQQYYGGGQPQYPPQAYPPQGYPPQGYPPQQPYYPPQQMQYQQGPPQPIIIQQQRPQKQDRGCLESCFAVLCCCFLCEEGCDICEACC